MKRLLPLLALSIFIFAQTEPVKDLHINHPRVWALTHAMIHPEPGEFIKDGTIIIRDGRIEKIGRYIQVPKDAYEVKKDEAENSPDDHWNQKVRPEYRAKNDLKVKEKDLKALRSIGITVAHVVPEKGIFKGQSDLVILNEPYLSLSKNASQVLEFKAGGRSDRGYPNSLLGTIALMRQSFLDAEWYTTQSEETNLSYTAYNRQQNLPQIFSVDNILDYQRVFKIADEFEIDFIIKGNGKEYSRIDEV